MSYPVLAEVFYCWCWGIQGCIIHPPSEHGWWFNGMEWWQWEIRKWCGLMQIQSDFVASWCKNVVGNEPPVDCPHDLIQLKAACYAQTTLLFFLLMNSFFPFWLFALPVTQLTGVFYQVMGTKKMHIHQIVQLVANGLNIQHGASLNNTNECLKVKILYPP